MVHTLLLIASLHSAGMDTLEPGEQAPAEEESLEWGAAPISAVGVWLLASATMTAATVGLCGLSMTACATNLAYPALAGFTYTGMCFVGPVALLAAALLTSVQPALSAVLAAPFAVLLAPDRGAAARTMLRAAALSVVLTPVSMVLMLALVAGVVSVVSMWAVFPPIQLTAGTPWNPAVGVAFATFVALTSASITVLGMGPAMASALALLATTLNQHAEARQRRRADASAWPTRSPELPDAPEQ